MHSDALRELSRTLIQQRLVEKSAITKVLRALPAGDDDMLRLLDALQSADLLTPFQVERIKKLDVDGLVLGGCKLLYANAAGSFARVYRGARLDSGEMVALKVLRQRWARDSDTVDLFKREAQLGMKLKHPNIVPIYELGCDKDEHFFVMEFVEGGNLKDFLRIRERLSPAEALRFTSDIARGLEYAISLGYTHRDLKLSNVLMSAAGVAKLIDFGLATDETAQKVGGENFQQALEYTTLEKGTGAPRNDPRSDLFFLGAILYELISGHAPYAATKNRDDRKRIGRYSSVRPLGHVVPECPRHVCDIVERLMTMQANDRFQSATELLRSLEESRRRLDQPSHLGGNSGHGKSSASLPSLLVVENRPKHQNLLRDYFSARGFRVLLMTDIGRALERLTTNSPHCIVFVLDGFPDEVQELIRATERARIPCILVLPFGETSEQAGVARGHRCILAQPVSLRDLRLHVEQLAGLRGSEEAVESA